AGGRGAGGGGRGGGGGGERGAGARRGGERRLRGGGRPRGDAAVGGQRAAVAQRAAAHAARADVELGCWRVDPHAPAAPLDEAARVVGVEIAQPHAWQDELGVGARAEEGAGEHFHERPGGGALGQLVERRQRHPLPETGPPLP